MSMDRVRALLSKTMERGCTENEEAASVAAAVRLIEREAYPHSAFEFPIRYSEVGVRLPKGQERKPPPKVEPEPSFRPRWEHQYQRRSYSDFAKDFRFYTKTRELGQETWEDIVKTTQKALGLSRKDAEEFVRAMGYTLKKDDKRTRPQQKGYRRVGELIDELIVARGQDGRPLSYASILFNVKRYFPHAKTTIQSVRWYETRARKEGNDIPKGRPDRYE